MLLSQCVADLKAEHYPLGDGPFLHCLALLCPREAYKELIVHTMVFGTIDVKAKYSFGIQVMESLLLLRGMKQGKESQERDGLANVKWHHYLWQKCRTSSEHQLVREKGGMGRLYRKGLELTHPAC